jgi:signal transduction histidine kinase
MEDSRLENEKMLIGPEKRSIKQVLTIIFLTATVLLALLVAMMAARQVFIYLKNDAISDTYQLAERLAKDSRLAIIQLASENVMPYVQMAQDFPNIEDIVIFEKIGLPLLGSIPKEIDFEEIAKTDFYEAKARILKETTDTIFILSPVIVETMNENSGSEDIVSRIESARVSSNSELIGYILISLSKAELYKTRKIVWRESLFVIIIIIGIFLFALMKVLNKITTPIYNLARFMTHPDTAKHYRKAPVIGVKEMRDISTAFNALMDALEHSNNALLRSKEKLEARVFERTQDLEFARDEARKYNKENRALISNMNSALEEERKFIARELHDHLNAELLFVKLKLRRFKTANVKQLIDTDKFGRKIEELIERISNVYDSSRNIVRMLRPEVIDSLGLIGAIKDRIDMFNTSHSECRVKFEYEGNFSDLNYHFSIAVFRIIQESLTNASKHAHATEINICLCYKCKNNPRGIYLCVSDNGRGFNTQTCTHSGIGLISMRERAYALNGKLNVESVAGEGTKIKAIIPLEI